MKQADRPHQGSPYPVTLELDVGDSYNRFNSQPIEVIEGFFAIETNDVRLIQRATAPADDENGLPIVSGAIIGYGPTTARGAGPRLDRMWFKEENAGGGAVVTFSGVVRAAHG